MSDRHGWPLLLRGIAAIIFGLLALLWPDVTVVVLALLFGAYVVFTGVMMLIGAFRRGADGTRRVAYVILGVLSVGAGVAAWIWPSITALALVVLVGAWALVTGVADIWVAARLGGHWLLVLTGLASVVAGVLILLRPDVGAFALAVVIGVYAIIAGALMVAEVWREHRPPETTARHRPAPAGH
jgi:uncharacterized membrane protein HdeD (DUF308 family)